MKTKYELLMMIEALETDGPVDWKRYASANGRSQAATLGKLVKWTEGEYVSHESSMMCSWVTDKGKEYFINKINNYWLKGWLTEEDLSGLKHDK